MSCAIHTAPSYSLLRCSLRFLLFLLILLAPISPALYQIFNGYPFIIYSNALDEGSYLQYDQSRFVSTHMIRPVQFLVTKLHEIGFSGGLINVLFDTAAPLTLWGLTSYVFVLQGITKSRAMWLSLLGWLACTAFLRINPIFDAVHKLLLGSNLITWITSPAASFHPIVRTPEPQSTYVVIAAAAIVCCRLRSYVPLLLTFPLLYSFVALPLAFVATAGVLSTMRTFKNLSPLLIGLFSAILVALALGFYYAIFLGSYAKHLSLESRAPLISVTGCCTLILYGIVRERFNEDRRRFLFFVAIAPWFAANHQIISGFLAQPSNAESYFGAPVAGALFLTMLANSQLLLKVTGAFLVAVYSLASVESVLDNAEPYYENGPPAELVGMLQSSPESVAVSDLLLATRLNLAYPMQSPTALSVNRVYIGVTDEALDRYVCTKQTIEHLGVANEFREAFAFLDSAYRDDFEDPLLNLRRTHTPRASLDVTSRRSSCERFPKVSVFWNSGRIDSISRHPVSVDRSF